MADTKAYQKILTVYRGLGSEIRFVAVPSSVRVEPLLPWSLDRLHS